MDEDRGHEDTSLMATRNLGPRLAIADTPRKPLDAPAPRESLGVRDTLENPHKPPQGDEIIAKQMRNRVFGRLFNKRERLKIGRYDILDSLGHGGMGVVYSAYDHELDRKVAIKVLLGQVDHDAELRFKREAQAMARLNHANVVTVHEVGEADGRVFIAMEFVRGESLADYCHVPRPWQETIDLYIQAGRGLAAAHEAGLVHRDLKPHNIMRGEHGVVKVLDFGLARAGGGDDPAGPTRPITKDQSSGSILDVEITRAGTLVGTPAYMAPEVLLGQLADTRSDQFSFCVALYEALYGQLPFAGETMKELTFHTAQGSIAPPPPGSKVPNWLFKTVARGLSPKPADRFADMRALVDALASNPNKKRRRLLTAAGFALLTGTLGFVASGVVDPTTSCETAAADIATTWSETRRQNIHDAFYDSGHRLAKSTLERVLPRLDAYAKKWTATRVAACQRHRFGQQSDRLFDLRTACLDRRRAQLDTLVSAFETADAATVEGAAWATASLPDLDTCSDVEALTSAVPPPKDQDVRREVKLLRESLAGLAALIDLGRYEQALAGSRNVLKRAEELGYDPLTAEALLRYGTAQLEAHHPDPARVSLTRSAAVALEAGSDEVAAEALSRRMYVVANPLGRPAVGLADADVAGALVNRRNDNTRLNWLYNNNHGVAHFRAGDAPAAEQAYRRALAALADKQQQFPVELISTGYNLSTLLYSNARPDSAAAELRSVRRQAISLLGEQHPRVAEITVQLTLYLSDTGQYHEASTLLDQSLDQVDADNPYLRASLLTVYTQLSYARRDYPKTIEYAEAAALLIQRHHPDHPFQLQVRALQALASIAQGTPEPGLSDLRAAVETTEASLGSEHETTGHARWWYANGLQAAGQRDAAIAEFERADAIYNQLGALGPALVARHGASWVRAKLASKDLEGADKALQAVARAQQHLGLPADNPHRLEIGWLRGQLALLEGHADAAASELEHVCTTMQLFRDSDDPQLAACRLTWAQALGDTAKSLELAALAQSTFSTLGPGFADELAQAQLLTPSADDGDGNPVNPM